MANIKVSITDLAKIKLKKITEFILIHHTSKEVKKLEKKIRETKRLLEKGNVNFKYSSEFNVYKVVIHKYSTMYYQKIDEENTHIIYFWDNRMNDEFNPFEK